MGAAYFVLFFALLLTGFATVSRIQFNQAKEQAYFRKVTGETKMAISRQLEIYMNVLRSVNALYGASRYVERGEFSSFIKAIDIDERYPGIDGIGYIRRVNRRHLKSFTTRVRADTGIHPDGYPDFKVHPEGDRKEYFVIDFIEPFNSNQALFGLDVSTEPALFATMQKAMQSGHFSFVEALSPDWSHLGSGSDFIMVEPVYRNGARTVTELEKSKALAGFVFERFDIGRLLGHVVDSAESSGIDFEISVKDENDQTRLVYHHEKKHEQYFDAIPSYYTHEAEIDLGTKKWMLFFHTRPEFQHLVYKDSPFLVVLGGVAVSLLLFGVTWMQARNLRERMVQAEALRHHATHDSLTGLPNRDLLYSRLIDALTSCDRTGRPLALLLIDLNGFKEINDTLGHHSGDHLLREIGPRIEAMLGPSDMVARLGGDEFAVVLGSLRSIHEASDAAQGLLNVIGDPFDLDGLKVKIGASIGIALYPRHGNTVSTLMRCADVAMYIAKKMTNGYAVYDSNLDQHTPRRLALMTELSDAIKDNQLILYFQPIINVKGHSIRSVEALIRWQHPKQGLIPSDQFIPDAENSELIKPITEWVLNEALAQCRVWQDSGLDIKVSVNISSRNLLDSELPNKIGMLLKKHGIQPDMLELEITESAIILDPDRCFDTLIRASAVGCPIAVDDFGTGYSSLAYLKSLPVSSLKIDCSFVTDMEKDENDAVIVRSIIDLAHNLGLNVIAEGVESQGVLNLLEILGCDQAQGYFISRPVSADKLGLWLRSFSARTKRRVI